MMHADAHPTIGEVARLSGVGVETIRFYERCGLLAQPERPANGYRRYPADTVPRLRFIQRAKELGFTLRETEELLHLRSSPEAGSGEVRARAAAKVADIEARIRDLDRMRTELAALVEACDGAGPIGDCCILEAITGDTHKGSR